MHGLTYTPCSSCCGDVFGDRGDDNGDRGDAVGDESNDTDDVIGDRGDVDVIDDRSDLIMQSAWTYRAGHPL